MASSGGYDVVAGNLLEHGENPNVAEKPSDRDYIIGSSEIDVVILADSELDYALYVKEENPEVIVELLVS